MLLITLLTSTGHFTYEEIISLNQTSCMSPKCFHLFIIGSQTVLKHLSKPDPCASWMFPCGGWSACTGNPAPVVTAMWRPVLTVTLVS